MKKSEKDNLKKSRIQGRKKCTVNKEMSKVNKIKFKRKKQRNKYQ